MRGDTSRGPYLDAASLPENRDDITKILLRVMGAGHPLNIDGIGGGNQVTNKVAILSRSNNKETDIDYLFAPANNGGTIAARYFMPRHAHPSMAVILAQCLASCAALPGSIAEGLLVRPTISLATITIEHPSGMIE